MAADPSFRYPGDVAMARLLAEVCCPRTLGECRALLRGAVAAQRTPLPSVLVRELFLGREPKFRDLAQADRFVAALFALLGELQVRFAAAEFSSEAAARVVGSLEDRAGARYREVRAFLRGLDLGATDPRELDEDGRSALAALTDASAYLGAMSGLAHTDAPTQADLAARTGASLAGLETMTGECMRRIESSLRQTRGPSGERAPDCGVGPSDLCSCGSGKPTRRCCGAPA